MERYDSPFDRILKAIFSFFVAVMLFFLLITSYREKRYNARMYTVPVTGIVSECSSYRIERSSGRKQRMETNYKITVKYEVSGSEYLYERNGLSRSYQVGEEVSLMCNANTGDAVFPGDTKLNVLLFVSGVLTALCALCCGIWLIVSAVRG